MKILLQRAQSVEPAFKINGFIVDDAATEIDPIRHDDALTLQKKSKIGLDCIVN